MSTPFNKNTHLDDALRSHRMRHLEILMTKALAKREAIKDALQENYGDKLATRAINSGSYAKHTAVNIKFDVDICQPFTRNSFATLEAMADDIYDFFLNTYKPDDNQLLLVQKQRKSTGLTFLIDGDQVLIDVVPGRELEQGDYVKNNYLFLHVRTKHTHTATCTQTNVQAHVDHLSGKTQQRPVIRLLKLWKAHKGKTYVKSFFLELIVIRAFTHHASEIPTDLWGRLKTTMTYIRDKIETIRLVDPANSNNNVANTMEDWEKRNLADEMRTMLKRIEEDEENLMLYFPINEDYADTKTAASLAGPAVLTPKRFG